MSIWPCRISRKMTPESLRLHGPLIEATWSSPSQETKGVKGVLILDTGASGIMIDESIAGQLQLPVIGQDHIHGAHGWATAKKHMANLLLPVSSKDGEYFMFNCPVECSSIPDLHSRYMKSNTPVIGILGRVFLQFCTLNVCGETGSIEVCINSSIAKARP